MKKDFRKIDKRAVSKIKHLNKWTKNAGIPNKEIRMVKKEKIYCGTKAVRIYTLQIDGNKFHIDDSLNGLERILDWCIENPDEKWGIME